MIMRTTLSVLLASLAVASGIAIADPTNGPANDAADDDATSDDAANDDSANDATRDAPDVTNDTITDTTDDATDDATDVESTDVESTDAPSRPAPSPPAPSRPAPRRPAPRAHSMAPPTDSFQFTMTAGKGRLGVAVLQISPALRDHLGAPDDRGVLVDAVRPGSPAARAGLRVGDVILAIDGDDARAATDLLKAMNHRKKGEAIAISIQRGDQRSELRATLDDDPVVEWLGPNGVDKLTPRLRHFDDMPLFEGFGGGGESMRKQIEALERRLERLERVTPSVRSRT
jgi:C-terminal processing protease CtpA/Prc